MPAHPVPIDLHLGADALVDVLILQWRTPVLENGGKIPAPIAASKGRLLEQLNNWLIQDFEARVPPRPLFVLAPELSMPNGCDDLLKGIVAGMHRPAVFIAGLEFLLWQEYRVIVQQLPHMPPNPDIWLQGGHDGDVVNAAVIWVRDEVGQVRKYVCGKPGTSPAPTVSRGWPGS